MNEIPEIREDDSVENIEKKEKFDLKKLRPEFVQDWYTKMGKK